LIFYYLILRDDGDESFIKQFFQVQVVKGLPNRPRINFVIVSSAVIVRVGAVVLIAASLDLAAINRALTSWSVSGLAGAISCSLEATA
jgi:hypothetical protein